MRKLYVRELKDQPKFRGILNFSTIKEEKDAEKERYEIISNVQRKHDEYLSFGQRLFLLESSEDNLDKLHRNFYQKLFLPAFLYSTVVGTPEQIIALEWPSLGVIRPDAQAMACYSRE